MGRVLRAVVDVRGKSGQGDPIPIVGERESPVVSPDVEESIDMESVPRRMEGPRDLEKLVESSSSSTVRSPPITDSTNDRSPSWPSINCFSNSSDILSCSSNRRNSFRDEPRLEGLVGPLSGFISVTKSRGLFSKDDRSELGGRIGIGWVSRLHRLTERLPLELPIGPVAAVLAKEDRRENSWDISGIGVRGRLLLTEEVKFSDWEVMQGGTVNGSNIGRSARGLATYRGTVRNSSYDEVGLRADRRGLSVATYFTHVITHSTLLQRLLLF